MSRMYLFHHCHSPDLRWAIAILNQGSHTWLQIWLSGDSFPSLLQIVKIVCWPPFSKKSCWLHVKWCHLDTWLTDRSDRLVSGKPL
jgi:hypothetical protein